MDLLKVRTLPYLSRRNYYYEFWQLIPWSMLAGLVEGQFGSVVVSRTFNGSELLIAIATATPVAAMMSSLLWGMLCIGRRKVRLTAIFGAGVVLCAGTAGAIPATRAGAVWFICQMAAAQILLTGVVNTRTAFWKSNYPRTERGRITARLQGVRFVTTVTAVLAASAICDRDPMSYRFLYPAAAVFGTVGILMLSRLHIRGERNELRLHRASPRDIDPRGAAVEPFSVTALLSPGQVLGQMVRILREDRRFARYCVAQFFTGIANLMTVSVAVAVITRELNIGYVWGFWISSGLLIAIPRLAMLGSLGRWGRLFDRLGVVRLRVLSVVCWSAALTFGMGATYMASNPHVCGTAWLPLAVGLFALRGLASGVGLGGGALAWHIGHLHFARPDQAEMYMGIHVSLTGIRGLIAPLGGMWLYGIIGWPVWIVAIAASLTSLSLYAAMARQERREGAPTQPGEAPLKMTK